jgi:di/tricarboxylate transporter
MSQQQEEIAAIERLQNIQSNIKVTTGIAIGTVLLLYFFSFAMLVDTGMTGALMFEVITTVLCVLGLIYLNKLAFFILKSLYQRSKAYRHLFPVLTAKNIGDKAEDLAHLMAQQQAAQQQAPLTGA